MAGDPRARPRTPAPRPTVAHYHHQSSSSNSSSSGGSNIKINSSIANPPLELLRPKPPIVETGSSTLRGHKPATSGRTRFIYRLSDRPRHPGSPRNIISPDLSIIVENIPIDIHTIRSTDQLTKQDEYSLIDKVGRQGEFLVYRNIETPFNALI